MINNCANICIGESASFLFVLRVKAEKIIKSGPTWWKLSLSWILKKFHAGPVLTETIYCLGAISIWKIVYTTVNGLRLDCFPYGRSPCNVEEYENWGKNQVQASGKIEYSFEFLTYVQYEDISPHIRFLTRSCLQKSYYVGKGISHILTVHPWWAWKSTLSEIIEYAKATQGKQWNF